MVGKTAVKGHGLCDEGRPRYNSDGSSDIDWRRRWPRQGRAKCRCGLLSELGISQNAAKKWHKQHKADVLAEANQ